MLPVETKYRFLHFHEPFFKWSWVSDVSNLRTWMLARMKSCSILLPRRVLIETFTFVIAERRCCRFLARCDPTHDATNTNGSPSMDCLWTGNYIFKNRVLTQTWKTGWRGIPENQKKFRHFLKSGKNMEIEVQNLLWNKIKVLDWCKRTTIYSMELLLFVHLLERNHRLRLSSNFHSPISNSPPSSNQYLMEY